MAAVLNNKIQPYNIGEFTLDTASELSMLPTLENGGTGDLSAYGPVAQGSTAFVIATSAVYMLNGSGEWVEI